MLTSIHMNKASREYSHSLKNFMIWSNNQTTILPFGQRIRCLSLSSAVEFFSAFSQNDLLPHFNSVSCTCWLIHKLDKNKIIFCIPMNPETPPPHQTKPCPHRIVKDDLINFEKKHFFHENTSQKCQRNL